MRNMRPGGVLGDPKWDGETLADRIRNQNIWDTGHAIEQNNLLLEQQLIENKANADKQANATIEAARIKANADKQAKLEEAKLAIQLENLKQTFIKENKMSELFLSIGASYKTVTNFIEYLNKITNSDKLQRLNNNLENAQKELHTISSSEQTFKNKLLNIQYQITSIESTKQNYIKRHNLFTKLFNSNYKNRISNYNIDILRAKEKLNTIKEYYSNNIDMLNVESEEKQQRLIQHINQLTNQIAKCKLDQETLFTKRYNDFTEFRKTHYNKSLETAFYEANLPIFVIDKKDIISEGTVEQYMDYMIDKIYRGE